MKGLKTISVAFLTLSMALMLSSCGGKSSVNKNRDIVKDYSDEEYAELTRNEDGAKYNDALSAVTLYTDQCKTTFYLGEVFDSTGLVVERTLSRKNLETQEVTFVDQITDDYTINYEEVDMNKIGTYPVYITVRVGVSTMQKAYYIDVKSSLFENTANLNYVAGVKARYVASGQSIKQYTMGVDVIKEIKASDIKLELVRNSVDANKEITQTFENLSASDSKLTIDFDNVDYSKEGSYVIRITYNAGKVTIDGQEYDNIVTSFVGVSIINPIKSIAIEESTDTFEFNVQYNAIEYFANNGWKIRATHTNGEDEIIDVTGELFEVTNMQTLYWDKAQKITLTLKGTECKITSTIIIVNEGASVKLFNDLKCLDADAEGAYVEGLGYKIVIDEDGILFGPNPTTGNATYTTGRADKDKYDGLGFDTRVSIKGDKQAFSIKVNNASEDKPTTIVVYFATSSDEVRELIFLDPNNEETVYESPSTKQTITKAIYYAKSNGVYKFYASASMYIHGVMIVESNK